MSKPRPFQRLLVANRGEIACRVIRTARAMGLETVAVYSDADLDAPHVKMADKAIRIGPGPSAQSYLNIDAIMEAARIALADAIHPGYGFLSENADFARAVAKGGNPFRGCTWVGPPPDVIDMMADKAVAKARMIEAGVPTIPGYDGADQSEEAMLAAADRIGWPVMIKATAGGGGRGMRLAEKGGHSSNSLHNALTAARTEAEAAFGNGHLMLEKAIMEARHVEVQVFADTHGNVIHLGERDCSVQRRNQKVIEEAPAPGLSDDLRATMCQAAVEAARAVGYVGAGTVEFLLDPDDNFYFIEMNTRLQVEHPVTEMITGLDLVELQLRVAMGEPLGLTQDDILMTGHAIEARLCAEDYRAAFMPQTGSVALWQPPEGPGIRVDAGIETGGEISPFYDSMVAKIIAHGADRDQARARLKSALAETALLGVRTNRGTLAGILDQTEFADGKATTALLGTGGEESCYPHGGEGSPWFRAVAVALWTRLQQDRAVARSTGVAKDLLGWSSAGPRDDVRTFRIGDYEGPMLIKVDGNGYTVTEDGFSLGFVGPDDAMITNPITWMDASDAQRKLVDPRLVSPDAASLNITITTIDDLQIDGSDVRARLDNGMVLNFVHAVAPDGTLILQEGEGFETWEVTETTFHRARKPTEADMLSTSIKAPMFGVLVGLDVAIGDIVEGWRTVATVEAMKMRHDIGIAGGRGRVVRIGAALGDQVTLGQVIVELEAIAPEDDTDKTAED